MKHHQGYLLKELLVQANNAEEFEVIMNMGGLVMGADDGCWLLLSCRVPVGVFLNDFVNLHGGDCNVARCLPHVVQNKWLFSNDRYRVPSSAP